MYNDDDDDDDDDHDDDDNDDDDDINIIIIICLYSDGDNIPRFSWNDPIQNLKIASIHSVGQTIDTDQEPRRSLCEAMYICTLSQTRPTEINMNINVTKILKVSHIMGCLVDMHRNDVACRDINYKMITTWETKNHVIGRRYIKDRWSIKADHTLVVSCWRNFVPADLPLINIACGYRDVHARGGGYLVSFFDETRCRITLNMNLFEASGHKDTDPAILRYFSGVWTAERLDVSHGPLFMGNNKPCHRLTTIIDCRNVTTCEQISTCVQPGSRR